MTWRHTAVRRRIITGMDDAVTSTSASPRPIAMGDERLIEALRADGCPLCRYVARVGGDYLGSLLYDQVNVVEVRRRFDQGGGFCARHVRATRSHEHRHSGGLTGTAILLRSMLVARRQSLERVLASRRPSANDLRAAVEIGRSCLVCAQEASAETDATHRFTSHAASDPAWRAAVSTAAWCIGHVAVLTEAFAATRDGTAREAFAAAQSRRLASLDERLERFIHHSAADRRHLQTEEERAAVGDVEKLLGGGSRE